MSRGLCGFALCSLSAVVVSSCGGQPSNSFFSDVPANSAAGSGASSPRGVQAGGAGGAAGNSAGASGDVGRGGVAGANGSIAGAGGAADTRVNVLLLVDKSGSMLGKPDSYSESKWRTLLGAFSEVFPAVAADVSLGLELFPESADPSRPMTEFCDDNCCDMPAANAAIKVQISGTATRQSEVLAVLEAAEPAGMSPTTLALSHALTYFTSGAGKDLSGKRYVVLVTDGGPNCNAELTCTESTCTSYLDRNTCRLANTCCIPNTERGRKQCLDHVAAKQRLSELAAANVGTFIVALPGSEPYAEYFEQFAAVAGVSNPDAPPAYFSASESAGPDAVKAALEQILTDLVLR